MRGYLKALLQRRVPAPVRKWAQLIADRLPPSVRYGKPYREALDLLSESETWDEKALVAYQEKRLQVLVNHCYANIPYYREVFQQYGLNPKDIQTVIDLQKLPFLTKEIVRKRKKDLVATNISFLSREEVSTSGSTGAPLDFYMDPTTRPMERALAFRHLSWLGYKEGDGLAVFKVPPLSDPKQFHQYLPRSNELRISFRDTDEPRLEKMVDLLQQFKPDFISAWPSSLYILARWMERNKRTIPPPKFIVTGSENMYPHMTERIEAVFKAPVSDFYGQEESVAIAMQCAMGEGYHIQMEMGIVELVPFRDGMSEIVGTGLHNMVMPFLRYRTGDLATDSSDACPCGRKHPLISDIVGREADLIVTPEGKLVSPLLLNPPFNRLEEIKEGQIIQEDIKTLRIIIVPWESISESTKEQLGREIRGSLASPSMRVIIEEAESIPRSGSCKKAFVVSRIRLEDYSRGRIGAQRVLVVGPVPPPYGGIASVMEDIVNSDLSKEYLFEIFDRSAVFPPGAEGFIGKNLFRARRFLRFFKKVRSGKYHFVHIHSSDPVFLGTTIFMLLSRLAGVKILLHVHGTDWTSFYSEAPLFKKFYTRIGLELPAKIVVLYQLWVDKVKELRPNADVRILRNFTHEQDPPSAREIEEARQSLGLTKENFVVLTVGSVGKNKGSFEILKAVPKAISKDDSLRFVLLGGEERPGNMAQLTSIVKEEKLSPWVQLTGELEREKVPAFLGFADIFLLPSFWEGMPVTIIEAMRSGLPIISTPVAGIPDMIDDGVSGLLINPGSPDEIAEAVLLLKRDKALRDKLAAGAKERFEEKFEFSKGIEEIRVLYASM